MSDRLIQHCRIPSTTVHRPVHLTYHSPIDRQVDTELQYLSIMEVTFTGLLD